VPVALAARQATGLASASWLGWLDRLGSRHPAPSKPVGHADKEGQAEAIMGACSGQRKMQLTSADRRFWRGVVRRSITLRGARDFHFCIARLLDATRLSGVARAH